MKKIRVLEIQLEEHKTVDNGALSIKEEKIKVE